MTYREVTREVAFGNHGLVTTQQAADTGVPPAELANAAALLTCHNRIESSRLLAGAEQARTEGLLATTEWHHCQEVLTA